MTLNEWEKDNEAFLIKIGQTAPAAPKPATKKDEE
jgi:hypothetical protein